jgi:hypothetical protein
MLPVFAFARRLPAGTDSPAFAWAFLTRSTSETSGSGERCFGVIVSTTIPAFPASSASTTVSASITCGLSPATSTCLVAGIAVTKVPSEASTVRRASATDAGSACRSVRSART